MILTYTVHYLTPAGKVNVGKTKKFTDIVEANTFAKEHFGSTLSFILK
jgi:hypothetical protein